MTVVLTSVGPWTQVTCSLREGLKEPHNTALETIQVVQEKLAKKLGDRIKIILIL